MGIWSKFNLWLLKSDVKDLKKGNTGDKIQALYDLEFLSNRILSKGLYSLYDPELEEIPYESFDEELMDIYRKYEYQHYWGHEIQEIVKLKEDHEDFLHIAMIYDIIFNGLDLSYSEIKLNTNNVKKIVTNISEIFEKKQSKKIISDIHTVISKGLEDCENKIKDYEEWMNILTKSKINKLTKFATEELKEEYIDDILSDIDYEGNTYDEDIVRSSEENSDEFMTWLAEIYEKPWDEILNEKVNELKKRPKEYKSSIDELNTEIDNIKKYALCFGYDIK